MQVRAKIAPAMNAARYISPPAYPHLRPVVSSDRYFGWRRTVEAFKAVAGVRPLLSHLPDGAWVRRFAANEDPVEAIVAELVDVD